MSVSKLDIRVHTSVVLLLQLNACCKICPGKHKSIEVDGSQVVISVTFTLKPATAGVD